MTSGHGALSCSIAIIQMSYGQPVGYEAECAAGVFSERRPFMTGVARMYFRLPEVLQKPDNDDALRLLKDYYRPRLGTLLGTFYTGASSDGWDSLGSRQADADRFTADDLVAVAFLGVAVPPKAALEAAVRHPRGLQRALAADP